MAEFAFSDDLELKQLNSDVNENPDDFALWEKLIDAAEKQEGRLNRNSSPSAIESTRAVYNRFLARYPLLFGYWKKYAELEFMIAGPEAAELVWERGISSVNTSVDLWTSYCSFKVETVHDVEITRELFERAADAVGLDFMAHDFWDKYIQYEERADNTERTFQILSRIIRIPMHQYYRYWTRFQVMMASRPLAELVATEPGASLLQIVRAEDAGRSQHDVERELRERLDVAYAQVHASTHAAVNSRWTYESEVRQPFYRPNGLDESQMENWRKYLDYEEGEGDYARTKFLYERCLVSTADYEEFWFRYARWMSAQGEKTEEVREIYQRASCLFIPIGSPDIRLSYANFEESVGRADTAADIHHAILINMSNHIETIISLADLHNRQYGLTSATEVLEGFINNPETSPVILGDLVHALASMVIAENGDSSAARTVWRSHVKQCSNSPAFWQGWFSFELSLSSSGTERDERRQRIKDLYEQIRQTGSLGTAEIDGLTARYIDFLKKSGGKEAMKEIIILDRNTYGPASVRKSVMIKNVNGTQSHL